MLREYRLKNHVSKPLSCFIWGQRVFYLVSSFFRNTMTSSLETIHFHDARKNRIRECKIKDTLIDIDGLVILLTLIQMNNSEMKIL